MACMVRSIPLVPKGLRFALHCIGHSLYTLSPQGAKLHFARHRSCTTPFTPKGLRFALHDIGYSLYTFSSQGARLRFTQHSVHFAPLAPKGQRFALYRMGHLLYTFTPQGAKVRFAQHGVFFQLPKAQCSLYMTQVISFAPLDPKGERFTLHGMGHSIYTFSPEGAKFALHGMGRSLYIFRPYGAKVRFAQHEPSALHLQSLRRSAMFATHLYFYAP